jgi:hypothetical protein
MDEAMSWDNAVERLIGKVRWRMDEIARFHEDERETDHGDKLGGGRIVDLEGERARVAREWLRDDFASLDVAWERRRTERDDEDGVRWLALSGDGY